ncbi:ABC transporter substrate-binding protein [Microlunatus ginsengisoli]|uniref:Siderophore-binding protein DesE n=1 Tax=Microlunatus ginsengisoli TaxID=363863 RepID=A0ABP7AX25_9ACTN
MPARTTRLLTLLVALLASAGPTLTAGCAASTPSSSPPVATGSVADGPWSFTDDLGKTVTLDHRPATVVALTDVAVSMLAYGVRPAGVFGRTNLDTDQRFTGFDVAGITDVDASYGDIDLEKLAAMAPDLIVTQGYPSKTGGAVDGSAPLYGFADLAQQDKVAKIAPIVTIAIVGNGARVIERTADLIVALGASADAGPLADGKRAYDAATAKLTAAAANGVTVQTMYAEAGNVYVAKAGDDPTLTLYASLGLRFVEPKTKNYYWDIVSWEDYDSIGGDLVLYSPEGFDKARLMKQPTFAATPAAKAGQVHPWLSTAMDYVTQAAYVDQLAGWVSAAKPLS